jgi:tetratricopeptide (TPR) repeat protein
MKQKNRIQNKKIMITKNIIFLIIMTFSINVIYAQSSISIITEIQNIEGAVNRQDIKPSERQTSLIRLARLRQLSGDLEGAAKNWLEAAVAIPNLIDDNALLSCAYCLAAMGEWDRASAALNPLLGKNPRARFLQTSINAWVTGDISVLTALISIPEYSQMKSEIYFILWKTSNSENWRQLLLTEYPQSPEARIAASEQTSIISIKPSPFWLFMNNRNTFFLMETTIENPPLIPPVSSDSRRLQTGLFSVRVNALTQAEQLGKAGFSPLIEQRTINGNEMWAVSVSAGQDINRSISELKTAGFESFPYR